MTGVIANDVSINFLTLLDVIAGTYRVSPWDALKRCTVKVATVS